MRNALRKYPNHDPKHWKLLQEKNHVFYLIKLVKATSPKNAQK